MAARLQTALNDRSAWEPNLSFRSITPHDLTHSPNREQIVNILPAKRVEKGMNASGLPIIEELRERIQHLESGPARRRTTLPFGVKEIDRRLPGGGLALGALHEVAGGGNGVVDGAAAGLFAAGITSQTFRRNSRASASERLRSYFRMGAVMSSIMVVPNSIPAARSR
jgi:hypothetical protein